MKKQQSTTGKCTMKTKSGKWFTQVGLKKNSRCEGKWRVKFNSYYRTFSVRGVNGLFQKCVRYFNCKSKWYSES